MALLLAPSATSVTAAGTAPTTTTNPLADLLRSPEDLLKLSVHRKRLVKEKSAIDARLNECVKTQLEETKDGLRRLIEARNGVGRLREEMIGIEQSKEEDDEVTQGRQGFEVFAKITKVSRRRETVSTIRPP
jgi:exocyst complex component 3